MIAPSVENKIALLFGEFVWFEMYLHGEGFCPEAGFPSHNWRTVARQDQGLRFATDVSDQGGCCFVQKISVFAPFRSANSGTVR